MKKLLPLLLLLLTGCGEEDPGMAAALELRSRCLAAGVTFEAEICADYITAWEQFDLQCTLAPEGAMSFSVLAPEDISGITGTVEGAAGTITFDDTVLAFPLMADGHLSPVSAPWVVMKALRSGCILAVNQEEELLHITVDDSYEDNALTVEIWAENGLLREAEIAWEGRRQVTVSIDNFGFSA